MRCLDDVIDIYGIHFGEFGLDIMYNRVFQGNLSSQLHKRNMIQS